MRQGGLRGCRNSAQVSLLPLPFMSKIERVRSRRKHGVSRRFCQMDTGRRPHRTLCGYEREPGIPALLLQELRLTPAQVEPQSAVLGRAERIIGFGSRHEASGEYLLGGACSLVCVGRSNCQERGAVGRTRQWRRRLIFPAICRSVSPAGHTSRRSNGRRAWWRRPSRTIGRHTGASVAACVVSESPRPKNREPSLQSRACRGVFDG